MIRTLIVDDEPLARRRIRKLLAAHDDIEIVGESGGGEKAIADIGSHRPDLVFLDIQMPGVDGFGVVERIGPRGMPLVIFVTAHEEYALKAFEIAALDYLLKPLDADRLASALDRTREKFAGRRGAGALGKQLAAALKEVHSSTRFPSRLAVREDGRVILLPVVEIEWIEAAGKYVRLHTRSKSHLLRGSISTIQKSLDPQLFVRIHRSAIVNLNCIAELEPTFHGEHTVLLRNGHRLTLSRGYRSHFRALFGGSL